MESHSVRLPGPALELSPHWVLMLFFFLLMAAPGLDAGIYKWTDEQGRVHFSDRPVDDSSSEVKIRQSPATETPSNEERQQRDLKMKRMLDAFEEDRANKKEAKQKQRQEREKRKRNCLLAKDRYNSHNRARGIYSYKKDGERRYLNDSERQSHMKKLKADVERWCK